MWRFDFKEAYEYGGMVHLAGRDNADPVIVPVEIRDFLHDPENLGEFTEKFKGKNIKLHYIGWPAPVLGTVSDATNTAIFVRNIAFEVGSCANYFEHPTHNETYLCNMGAREKYVQLLNAKIKLEKLFMVVSQNAMEKLTEQRNRIVKGMIKLQYEIDGNTKTNWSDGVVRFANSYIASSGRE